MRNIKQNALQIAKKDGTFSKIVFIFNKLWCKSIVFENLIIFGRVQLKFDQSSFFVKEFLYL